jgi:hypothetical protein
MTVKMSIFFTLSESTSVFASRKTLVKLTPGINLIPNSFLLVNSFFQYVTIKLTSKNRKNKGNEFFEGLTIVQW